MLTVDINAHYGVVSEFNVLSPDVIEIRRNECVPSASLAHKHKSCTTVNQTSDFGRITFTTELLGVSTGCLQELCSVTRSRPC